LYIRNTDDEPRHTVIVEGRFNDDNLTHQSYRKIGRRKRWNNRGSLMNRPCSSYCSLSLSVDTLRFYQALRMCGTDFTLIAHVFPNRDRNDIKRKFKTEDKANRTLIDSALSTYDENPSNFLHVFSRFGLGQRIPFDLTCFYSPSEDSSDDDNISDTENMSEKKTCKRRRRRRRRQQTRTKQVDTQVS
jgi:hypothetical protein